MMFIWRLKFSKTLLLSAWRLVELFGRKLNGKGTLGPARRLLTW